MEEKKPVKQFTWRCEHCDMEYLVYTRERKPEQFCSWCGMESKFVKEVEAPTQGDKYGN